MARAATQRAAATAGDPPAPAAETLVPYTDTLVPYMDALVPYMDALVPYIIGGQATSITQYPWQVYVVANQGSGTVGSCGGAILSATTIITVAHCVTEEGSTTPLPTTDVEVVAGASEVLLPQGVARPATRQVATTIASMRVDPLYVPAAEHVKDDVALLTLRTPLNLSASLGTAMIGLVAARATPPPGATLTVTGYGRQNGAETPENQPDGKLYAATMTALSSDACREDVGVNSAVLLCAVSATSATCQGDSGGPLVEGTPAVLVGLVDVGPKECPAGHPDLFTNLAAPEVRAFVEGASTIPNAARPSSPPAIKSVGATPVDYSPLTCEPGTWSESPSFTYTFELENGSGKVVQSGASNVYTPPATVVGAPLVCIVEASNTGGVSTARSPNTPPIATDTSPPTASITAPPTCHLRTCTLKISASDPNGASINLAASASYPSCSVVKKKRATHARRKTCVKTKTVPMALSGGSHGGYRARISRLPYGGRIAFSVLAIDAAGLKQATPAVTSVTLRKPAAKANPRARRARPRPKP
jgi:hypothetical protein